LDLFLSWLRSQLFEASYRLGGEIFLAAYQTNFTGNATEFSHSTGSPPKVGDSALHHLSSAGIAAHLLLPLHD
jgi:hypothetical protein